MKLKIILLGAGLLLGASAQAALLHYQFNGLNALIPDGNVNGYQNAQTISGLGVHESVITDVNVRLNFSGGYNGDLYVYLSHSSGFSVLLNRAGRTGGNSFGYGDAGFNVWLDDSAAGDIHNYGGNSGAPLAGTYQPDARNVNPATVTDLSSRSAFLSAFNGLDPNGTWTLFVADVSGGDANTLVSWELEITAVPEPTIWALGIFGGVWLTVSGVRRWNRHFSGWPINSVTFRQKIFGKG